MIMFGLFNRRRVLEQIISLMEAQIDAYDWVMKGTLKELDELFIVMKDKLEEKKISESMGS